MTANIQLSGKSASGIIAVVGGDNFDDFYQNLVAFLGGDVNTADATIREASRLIVPPTAHADPYADQAIQNLQQAGLNPQPLPPQQHQPQQQYPQQPAPQHQTPPQAPQRQISGPPPGQQAPLCEHGYAREFKSGTSKAGKSYKMWSCPMDRDQQCEPVWLR